MSTTIHKAPGRSARPLISTVVNISDRGGMPRLGKLRLGEKKKTAGGKEYPSELDYFRCDPEEGMLPADRIELAKRFKDLYGERPTTLTNVYLPSDDRAFTFPNSLEAWKQTQGRSKRWCHGDGVRAERLDFQTGEWSEMRCCHVEECPIMSAGDCKLISRLRIFVPDVSMAGYWQIDTSSQASTGNVIDCLNQLETIFGRLMNIPLVISREPKAMTFEGKANTHYVIHLRPPNVNLEQFKQLVAKRQMALPAPEVDADDLDAIDDDIPEELIPESIQESAADPELLKKIEQGFDILGTSKANRAVSLHQFKGREAELLRVINGRVDKQTAGAQP